MFKHNGIEISVTDSGAFTATKNGEELKSTSLAGIKKKIDGKDTFKPFAALHERYHGTGHAEVKVIGVKKSRAEWRGDEWCLDNNEYAYNVVENTAANRKLIEQLELKNALRHDAVTRFDDEIKALAAKITRLRPPKREK